MKNLVLLLCVLVFAACGKKTQPADEAPAEEYAEEAAAEMEAEEVAEEPRREDYYDLKPLECKDANGLILSNIYQLTPHEVDQIDQEPSFYGSILDLRYRFHTAVKTCLGDESTSPDQFDRFLKPQINETGSRGRTDLMPQIEDEMYLVPAWLTDVASKKLIPSPQNSQYNGIVYQRLYDYYRNEFRKLHLAYLLLNNYSSFEYEMRLYASAAQQTRINSDGTLSYSNNYQSFFRFLNRYMEPYWSNFESIDIGSNMHNYSAFWLRRGLDESAGELVALQEKIIARFDPVWQAEVNERFNTALPKITFDTASYDTYVDGGKVIIETDSITPFFEQAENGILIKFDNGKSRFYEQGELGGFYINAYLPASNALIITQESDYPESFYLRLTDGEQMPIGGSVTDHYISPKGDFILAKYDGFESSGMLIYQLSDGKANLIFNSAYIKTPAGPQWLDDTRFILPLEMDGQLLFDLTIF